MEESVTILYERYHEMPQKACERGFCHVTAFEFFFEMLQSRTFSRFKIIQVIFPRNAPFPMVRNL